MLHKIVEYTATLRSKHVRQMRELAEGRNLGTVVAELKEISLTWRRRLDTEQFRPLRNKASGHYDGNIEEQVELIDQLDAAAALDTVKKFLAFHLEILSVLKTIGANKHV